MMRSVGAALVLLAVGLLGMMATRVEGVRERVLVEGAYLVRMQNFVDLQGMRDFVKQLRSEMHKEAPDAVGTITSLEIQHTMRAFEVLDANDAMVEYLQSFKAVRAVDQQDMVFLANEKPAASWGQDRIDQRDLPLNGEYSYEFSGQGVDVYVIDSGIDCNHDDLQPGKYGRTCENIFSTFSEDPLNPGVDDDDNSHGTHCSGTIGGITHGVAPGVNLFGIKTHNANGAGLLAQTVLGIDFAVGHSLNERPNNRAVLSMSIGFPCGKHCEANAMNEAVDRAAELGIISAIAAGNDADDACGYIPASASSAVTVGATEIDDDASSFTNYGPCVDMNAPGTDITSACANVTCGDESSFITYSGTSMATPHVAGVLAQMLQGYPTISVHDAKAYLLCASSKHRVNFDTASGSSVNALLYIIHSYNSWTDPYPCDYYYSFDDK